MIFIFEKFTFDTFHGVARRFTYERHKNMHEVRFHNVSIQPNIIYYILLPLSTIIVLVIKVVGFSKARQLSVKFFAMYCGNIRLIMKFFYLDFELRYLILYFMVEVMKKAYKHLFDFSF